MDNLFFSFFFLGNMLQSSTSESPLGPNVSSEANNFFQSDADIAFHNKKSLKKKQVEKKGQPIMMSSKVLCMLLDPAKTEFKSAFVGESGFIIKRLNLNVITFLY